MLLNLLNLKNCPSRCLSKELLWLVMQYDHKWFQPTWVNLSWYIGNTSRGFIFEIGDVPTLGPRLEGISTSSQTSCASPDETDHYDLKETGKITVKSTPYSLFKNIEQNTHKRRRKLRKWSCKLLNESTSNLKYFVVF